jgi:hypothetical protein
MLVQLNQVIEQLRILLLQPMGDRSIFALGLIRQGSDKRV